MNTQKKSSKKNSIEKSPEKVNRRGLPEVTPEYLAQLQFLDRCIYFALKGKFVDPRTIGGAVELFGSAEKLDAACTKAGLTRTGYVGNATL